MIGTEAATDLFGTWDAVGGTITIGERNYKVIGVLEEQGSSLVGSDDSKILIPYTTAERITGQKSVSTFYIKASSSNSVNVAINMVESFLLQTTRDEDSFTVNNQSDVLDTMDEVNNTMSLLLAGIAAISLLVGGIGIMNIMLVSVTERTREIGIRKAVGAKRQHIMLQFLCESCILSVLGGLIGLVLSAAVVSAYNTAAGSSAAINWGIGMAAIAFCAVIGILFEMCIRDSLSKAAIELQSKATEDEYVDYETFKRIKKGNGKALEALIDAHLKKAWFISFQLTEHVCRGAPLLIKAWKASLEQIISAQTAPKEDFREILHSNLLKLYFCLLYTSRRLQCREAADGFI